MKRLRKYPKQYPWRIVGTIVIVAAIGTTLIIGSRAASPYASQEAESGTLSGATKNTDSTASGGSYVQLGVLPSGNTGGGGSTGGGSTGGTGYTFDGSADKTTFTAWNNVKPWYVYQDGSVGGGDFGTSKTKLSVVSIPSAFTAAGYKETKAFHAVVGDACAGGYIGGCARAEINDTRQFHNGDHYWFGDVVYIPTQTGTAWVGNHDTTMQLHSQGDGSPPIQMDLQPNASTNAGWQFIVHQVTAGTVTTDPQLGVPSGSGNNTVRDNNSVVAVVPKAQLFDRVIRWEMDITFSTGSSGKVLTYINGTLVNTYTGPTVEKTGQLGSYLKEGLYGGSPGEIYFLGAKYGPTQASVLH